MMIALQEQTELCATFCVGGKVTGCSKHPTVPGVSMEMISAKEEQNFVFHCKRSTVNPVDGTPFMLRYTLLRKVVSIDSCLFQEL